jgi:hypothetical protein
MIILKLECYNCHKPLSPEEIDPFWLQEGNYKSGIIVFCVKCDDKSDDESSSDESN